MEVTELNVKAGDNTKAELDQTLPVTELDAEAQYVAACNFLSSARRIEGMELLRKSASQGFAQSQYELGRCLLEQAVSEDEFKEVISLLSSAATNWHGKAAYFLSKLHEEGLGVHNNSDKAQEWAKRSPDSAPDKLRYNYQYSQGQGELVYTKMRRDIRLARRAELEKHQHSSDISQENR